MSPDTAHVDAIEARSGKTRIPADRAGVRTAEDARLDVALIPGQRAGREPPVDGSGTSLRIGIVFVSEQSSELVLDPLEDASLGIAAATRPGIASAGNWNSLACSSRFCRTVSSE